MKKISRIKFENHPVLGFSEFNLIDKGEVKSKGYTTLILGQNGTGKSKMLEELTYALFHLKQNEYKKIKWDKLFDIEIDFCTDNGIRTYSSKDNDFNDFSDRLPDNVIVSAYTFNDKFLKLREDNAFYHYCGLKSATNNIFVNRPSEDCFHNFTSIILEGKDKEDVINIMFSELNLRKCISVTYKNAKGISILKEAKVRKILERTNETRIVSNADIEEFRSIIFNILTNKKGTSRRYQETSYKRFLEDKGDNNRLKKIIEYFSSNDMITTNQLGSLKSNIEFTYSWEKDLSSKDKIENERFRNHIEIFKYLKEIEIITFDNFKIYRNEFFDFNDASSGEFHFLHLFSSVLANIKENSLVIIDEPEISLHPNWQNRFILALQPIFSNYPDAQYIIASHSHFMVSSLEKERSAIITLKRNNSELLVSNLGKEINTLGWSAEQILFDVFGMITDRNPYITDIISEIIEEMSKISPDNDKIDGLKTRLRDLDLHHLESNDPMKKILEGLLA